jgi:hypothetical protein
VLTVRTRLFYARRELAQMMRAEPTLADLVDDEDPRPSQDPDRASQDPKRASQDLDRPRQDLKKRRESRSQASSDDGKRPRAKPRAEEP